MLKAHEDSVEKRLDEFQNLHLPEVTWQTQRNTDAIDKLTNEEARTAEAIGELKGSISVVNQKLDMLVEALKEREKNKDQ